MNSLFRMAVVAGVENSVRMHLDRGDDVNARDSNGMTPLMLAASKNKAAICALLLSRGADLGLADSHGRDALALARAAGASDAVTAMELFAPKVDLAIGGPGDAPAPEADDGSSAREPIIHAADEIEFTSEDDSLEDVSGWEAEEDNPAPIADGALVDAAIAGHEIISTHVPVDTAEDWSGFDAFLPEIAARLPNIGEEASRERAFGILRRALREGSVPERSIHEMLEGEEEPERESKDALLRVVLADLGAETDERFDHPESEGHWPERPEDEDDVAEALLHYEELLAFRNSPSRHYMRELQKVGKRITAEEEQSLSRAIEEGLAAAIDTLAGWPAGVTAFVDASRKVKDAEDEPELSIEALDGQPVGRFHDLEDGVLVDASAEDGDVDEDAHAVRDFFEKADAVRLLARMAGIGGDGQERLKSALLAAKPSAAFLARVAEMCSAECCPHGAAFRSALGRHERAKTRLVCANLRLVLDFVKKFSAFGLPFDDLVQEGSIGLMRAADGFDWRKGNRFSTYATWWIRQSVTRALADKVLTIRTPVHIHNVMLKLDKEAELLTRILGRHATSRDLSAHMSMPQTKVEALLARLHEPVSLHEPDGEGVAPIERAVDESRYGDPYALAERAALIATLEHLFVDLTDKEAELITMRFGLDGNDPRTLEELGIHYGVTRERIRQIESSALKTLAMTIRSDPLRTFLEGPASTPRLMKAAPGFVDHLPAQRKERKPRKKSSLDSAVDENGLDAGLVEVEGEQIELLPDLPDEKSSSASPERQPGLERANVSNATFKVIEMAKAAGAVVVDRREDGGGLVIRLVSEESRHRVVIRKLLSVGFEQSGGMEFRK